MFSLYRNSLYPKYKFLLTTYNHINRTKRFSNYSNYVLLNRFSTIGSIHLQNDDGKGKSCCSENQEINKFKLENDKLKDNNTGFWKDKMIWKRSSINTLRCLVGCSIGDLGVLTFMQNYHPEVSIQVAMPLAMISGITTSLLLETLFLKLKEKVPTWKDSMKTAAGMSMISMLMMESAENILEYTLYSSGIFSYSSNTFDLSSFLFINGLSMFAGFITPLPYTYYRLKKFNQSCH